MYDQITSLGKNSTPDITVFSSKGKGTDDSTTKTICENTNDIIITVDDNVRSHRIGKYDPQKKNPRPVIEKLA